jgi:hypothetical protein
MSAEYARVGIVLPDASAVDLINATLEMALRPAQNLCRIYTVATHTISNFYAVGAMYVEGHEWAVPWQ